MIDLYRGPSIDASYQVSVHLAKWFLEKILKKIDQSEIWIACGLSCLLTGRDEMSIINRGPSIDASYQVLVHLEKRFQRRIFHLEINQSETRIACGSHVCQQFGTKCAIFIEDLPQMFPIKFHFIWVKGFQRRLKYEKFRDDERQMMAKDCCLWQGELIKSHFMVFSQSEPNSRKIRFFHQKLHWATFVYGN